MQNWSLFYVVKDRFERIVLRVVVLPLGDQEAQDGDVVGLIVGDLVVEDLGVLVRHHLDAGARRQARDDGALETEVDEDAEQAWSAEIARRLDGLNSGSATTVPWSQARRRIFGD